MEQESPRINSDGRTAAETSHMRSNADLFNQQLTKMRARSKKSRGITRITFLTDNVGNMFDLKILLSCGIPKIDKEALKAVGSMVPMRDFGGKLNVNYLFESVFNVDHVKTEFNGRKSFEMPSLDDRPLRRGR
jgi:hypothetical protein